MRARRTAALVRGLASQAYLDRTWAFAAEIDRALEALTRATRSTPYCAST